MSLEKIALQNAYRALDDAIFIERKQLWGAATNPRDDRTREAYLRQWGALPGGKGEDKSDFLVSSPEGTRTVLNARLGDMKKVIDQMA